MYNNTGNQEAYIGMNLPISGTNINGTGLMLGERVKYTAVTGMAIISTANSYRNGTSGTYADLNTGGYCIVTRITIKAQGTTTKGMIRIFNRDQGGTSRLMMEVCVPPITQSALDQTVIAVINHPIYLGGHSNCRLRVSTEKAETFIITAEGLQYSFAW